MSETVAPSREEAYRPGRVCPADLRPLEPVEVTPVEQVKAVVAAARRAQQAWARRPLRERIQAVEEIGRQVVAERGAAARVLSDETGRSETECLMSELLVVDFIKGVVKAAKKALKAEKIRLSKIQLPGKRVVVEAVPRGVVGIIAPWNYPLGNFFKSLFPAVIAGNGVVMKPSEHTPRAGAWLADICARVLPEDLVGLVQGAGEVGRALIDAGVDSIIFTGSVSTGRKVAARAGELLIPCSVELGGKDAAIVLEDCDLERTALGIANWAMHNAGQNCAAIERVYVERAVAEPFVETLGRAVSRLKVAPEAEFTDLGPLQNRPQLDIVTAHVKDAQEKGARLVTGGHPTGDGFGYAPTVLAECTHDMRVMTEETFGPVVAVQSVENAEEAIERANDSRYGLNGSVWTRDISRGEELVRRMEVGVCYVNNHCLGGILPETPWTGVKDTGPGVASSQHAYHGFVRRRMVLVDKSSKPDPWWMPLNADIRELGEAVARVQLSQGVIGAVIKMAGLVGKRIKAIRSLVAR